jgi:hypothetical protein
MRRWFLALFIAVPSIAWGAWAQFTGYSPSGTGGAFVQLKIGGGGFVTGLQILPTGQQIARTDTAGAFVRSSHTATWTPVVTRASMPSSPTLNAAWSLNGVCEIVAAPSNPNHLYMYYRTIGVANSYILYSTDFGAHWTVTDSSFPDGTAGAQCVPNDQPNPNYRLNTPYMAVDPANENIIYVGTPSDGVWHSSSGGVGASAWSQISTGTIPGGGMGGDTGMGNLVAFDSYSSGCTTPVSSVSQCINITSYSNGVYRTTNGGSSWSELNSTGMPTTFVAIAVDSAGTMWIVDNAQGAELGSLYRYLVGSATWSKQITFSGNLALGGVAINPSDPNKVYAVNYQGCIVYSINGQAGSPTWHYTSNLPSNCGVGTDFTVTSSKIPWIQWSQDADQSAGRLAFDPSQSNVLYSAVGIGLMKAMPPADGTTTSITWNYDETVGIENLDLQCNAVALSGGGIFTCALDRPLWTLNGTSYPAQYFPDADQGTVGNPTHYVCQNGTTYMGNAAFTLQVSTTGGGAGTWSASGTSGLPSNFGAQNGACAIISSSTWVVFDSTFGYGPYITTNSGSSWSACTFASGKTAGGGGWAGSGFAQDSVTPGTLVMLNDGTGSTNGSGAKGVWKSTSGCSFTLVNDGTLPSGVGALTPVPGIADTYLAASVATPPNTGQGAFYLTTPANLKSTSTAIANVDTVWFRSYGFGKTKPGSDGFPEFYCICTYSGAGGSFGTWEIENLDSTPAWTKIGDGYPVSSIDGMYFLIGDMATYGTLYGGFYGSGGFYRTAN